MQRSERFVALDSWRGIAACFVALLHFRGGVNSHINDFNIFANAGLFVDFFFVLSGFVIFANYASRLSSGESFFKFMLLRFGRLYPLHLFVLLIYIGFELLQVLIPDLGALAVHEPFSQRGEQTDFIISSLFLVQAMGLYEDAIIAFSGPSWSISVEFYAYALFGLLLLGLKTKTKWVLPIITLLAFFWLVKTETYLGTTLKYGFLRCIYSFSAGALVWYFYGHFQGKVRNLVQKPSHWFCLELITVIGVVAYLSSKNAGVQQMMAMPVFVAVVMVFAFQSGVISRLLSHRFPLLLGTLSYSIYLLHSFIAGKAESVARYIAVQLPFDVISVSDAGKKVLGAEAWQGDILVLGYLATVVVCSLFTYKYIETPARKAVRKFVNKGKTNE